VSRLVDVYTYLIELQEDAEDLAAIEARKDEATLSIDNYIKEAV
jgi:hypothetical protein